MVKQRWLEHPTDGLKGIYSSFELQTHILLLRGKQTIMPPARAKERGKENSPHKVVMEASTGYGPAIAVWKTAVLPITLRRRGTSVST